QSYCRGRSSNARRIGFSREVPMFCDGGDEVFRPVTCVRRDDESRVRLTALDGRVDSAGREQRRARAYGKNRLAMAVLVFDEFERPPIATKGADGFVAV